MRGTSAARHILFTCLRASSVTKSILDRSYQDYPVHWTQYQIPWRKLDWIPDPWYLHDAPQVLHSDWISVLLLSRPRSAQAERQDYIPKPLISLYGSSGRETVCSSWTSRWYPGQPVWSALPGKGLYTMKISLRLWRHSVLRSSHPMPPAPTSSARVLSNDILDGYGCSECRILG